MKIVVCIKQVPDTTEIRLDPVTGTLIRDGVPSIMNPDDKAGLEKTSTAHTSPSSRWVPRRPMTSCAKPSQWVPTVRFI